MKYKNYFPLPNEIFSLGLSSGEIAVYAFLMYCEDRQTFQCHPSYKTIGEAINMSKNTVKKNVSLLTKKKLIQTEPTKILSKKGQTRNGSLRYTLLPISVALEYFNEQQMVKLEEQARRIQVQKLLEKDEKIASNSWPILVAGIRVGVAHTPDSAHFGRQRRPFKEFRALHIRGCKIAFFEGQESRFGIIEKNQWF